jgi:hypothetical protein
LFWLLLKRNFSVSFLWGTLGGSAPKPPGFFKALAFLEQSLLADTQHCGTAVAFASLRPSFRSAKAPAIPRQAGRVSAEPASLYFFSSSLINIVFPVAFEVDFQSPSHTAVAQL